MRVSDPIPAFEANLKRRGRKASTVATHGKNLEPFIRWIGDCPVNEIEPRDMEMYLDWYEVDFSERHGRSPANNTRGNIITALCVFFDWATKYDHIEKSPALGHSTTTITEQAYAELLPETVAADFLQGSRLRSRSRCSERRSAGSRGSIIEPPSTSSASRSSRPAQQHTRW
jgi:site-specific recombinase XerD